MTARNEVQAHGFLWEKDILQHVYFLTEEECNKIKYTSNIDLPAEYNRIDFCNLSVKVGKQENRVELGDPINQFDLTSGETYHLDKIHFKQEGNYKKVKSITEIDLTNSRELLFGSITREQLIQLSKVIQEVPIRERPTPEQYKKMYDLRDELHKNRGMLHLDIKCDSQNSRLQCSFKFKDFCKKYPDRVLHSSTTNEFRGGKISSEIYSLPRVRNKKVVEESH